MAMALYEINEKILDCVDTETGEIIDMEKLQALQLEMKTKYENIGLWIKQLEAEATALKAEKKSFEERQKRTEKKAESLKGYLATALRGEKFETERVAVSFRKTKKVEISDICKIPMEFLRMQDPVPDKTAIKNAIQAGETVEGAELVDNTSICIK